MMVNGRHLSDEEVTRRVSDINIAVQRMPIDDPFRVYLEFLIGVIAAQDDDLLDAAGDRSIVAAMEKNEGGPYEELFAIEL